MKRNWNTERLNFEACIEAEVSKADNDDIDGNDDSWNGNFENNCDSEDDDANYIGDENNAGDSDVSEKLVQGKEMMFSKGNRWRRDIFPM